MRGRGSTVARGHGGFAATRPSLAPPLGRQGPGPLPDAIVRAVDLAVGRRIAGRTGGDHRALGLGTGTELAQLRPYAIGDDVRLLDPSASARTGEPWVRQYVPERAVTTWLLVDISPSMAFGSARRLKADVAEGAARVLTRAGLRRAGRAALIRFGAGEPLLLAPRGGRAALAGIGRALAEGVAPDGFVDRGAMAGALRVMLALTRNPGVCAVISDFRDVDDWGRPLRALAVRHETMCIEIRDRREVALPDAGLVVLVDPETGAQVEADLSSARLRAAYARAERVRAVALAATIRRAGARHIIVDAGGDWLRALGAGVAR